MHRYWDVARKTTSRGLPSVSDAWNGVFLCTSNSRRLFLDAVALFRAERFASGLALGTIALEESSKSLVLIAAVCARDEKYRKRAWAAFENHKAKLGTAMGLIENLRVAYVGSGFGDLKDHMPSMTARVKELALYVTLLEGSGWSSPDTLVDRAGAMEWLTLCYVVIQKLHLAAYDSRGILRTLAQIAGPLGVEGPTRLLEFADSEEGRGILLADSHDFERWQGQVVEGGLPLDLDPPMEVELRGDPWPIPPGFDVRGTRSGADGETRLARSDGDRRS